MAKLLDDGVLVPGEGWDEPEHNDKTWRLAVGGRLDDDAHALERALVEAVRQKPNDGALVLASDVVDGPIGDQLDARLQALGLIYDETRRWRFWLFGLTWCLVGFGSALAQPRFCCEDQGIIDALAIGAGVAVIGLMASMPETMSADVARNGGAAVELERQRHPELEHDIERAQLGLEIALCGIGILDALRDGKAAGRQGTHLARKLLVAESKKTI